MNRRGQSWSMDLVVAIVVFGFIAVIFYSLLAIQQKPSIEDLQARASTIEEKLNGEILDCGAIIVNQTVTAQQLQCLYGKNASDLRTALGISGKFCIYVEDANNTIYVVNSDGNRTAIGDPALIVVDRACGSAT